jgi:hypothetical protein
VAVEEEDSVVVVELSDEESLEDEDVVAVDEISVDDSLVLVLVDSVEVGGLVELVVAGS